MGRQPFDSPWRDPANVDTVKKLWAAGLSASEIAVEVGQGVTRNAVIGLVHRLGLSERSRSNVPRMPRAQASPKPARTAPFKPPKYAAPSSDDVMEADGPTDLPADQSPDAVLFLKRDGNTCRWPLNDVLPITGHMSCGSPTPGDGDAYCLRHFEVSTRRAPASVKLAESEIARRKRQGQLNFEKRSDYRDAAWR